MRAALGGSGRYLRNRVTIAITPRTNARDGDMGQRARFPAPGHEVHVSPPKGGTMKVKAAVAHRAGAPLTIETVDLDGPRAGEVLLEVKASGVCHTDAFTLSGDD